MLTIGIVAGLGFGWWKIALRAKPITKFSGINSVARTSAGEFQKLKGRWRRPDGGYIMAINSINDAGALDAAYFNRIQFMLATPSRLGTEMSRKSLSSFEM